MSKKFTRAVMKAIFVLACVSAVLAVQSNNGNMPIEQQQAIEKAVLKIHSQMTQADNELDAEKFFSYIPDFDKGLIIRDGRLFQTREAAFEAVKKGFEGISKSNRTYEKTYVTVISPETALLTAEGTSTVTLSDGRTFSNPFAVSMVYVMRDGQWKVLHGHYSIPNPR
ncbi:MAG: SgcJ/EcaC family oxidoreductase [Sedimentisphaerales bacterium]